VDAVDADDAVDAVVDDAAVEAVDADAAVDAVVDDAVEAVDAVDAVVDGAEVVEVAAEEGTVVAEVIERRGGIADGRNNRLHGGPGLCPPHSVFS